MILARITRITRIYWCDADKSQNFRKFCPTRPERAEAPSPGQRPGVLWTQTCRPVRAKALLIARYFKAFALTGRLVDCYYTQGDALG